jgi:hypothetical protein
LWSQGGGLGGLTLGYFLLPLRGASFWRAKREFFGGCQKEKWRLLTVADGV